MSRPALLSRVLSCALLLSVVSPAVPAAVPPADAAPTPAEGASARVDFTRWQGTADWRDGDGRGVTALPGPFTGLVMGRPAGATQHHDPHGDTSNWEYSTWTSPVTELPFGATELVASWSASTPGGSWLSVQVQATYDDATASPWYVLGNWTSHDDGVARASVDGQQDARSEIRTDTLATVRGSGHTFDAYRLRVTLYRRPGSLVVPRVRMLGAMASAVPDRFSVEPSVGGVASGEKLAVPRRSASIHAGSYPQYGGGTGWSGPAAVAMVMEYFDTVPSRKDMAWIDPGYTDPQVAHAARMVWDHTLDGSGNWSFGTAYASSFPGLDAFVTRLRSLNEVERFIDAGIPVITSQSFRESELDGAGYATSGSLMVVTGFTDDGDVIVNDPAAPSSGTVRRVYKREQFEQVWLRSQRRLAGGETASGSGGIAYIVRPYGLDLPEPADGPSAAW